MTSRGRERSGGILPLHHHHQHHSTHRRLLLPPPEVCTTCAVQDTVRANLISRTGCLPLSIALNQTLRRSWPASQPHNIAGRGVLRLRPKETIMYQPPRRGPTSMATIMIQFWTRCDAMRCCPAQDNIMCCPASETFDNHHHPHPLRIIISILKPRSRLRHPRSSANGHTERGRSRTQKVIFQSIFPFRSKLFMIRRSWRWLLVRRGPQNINELSVNTSPRPFDQWSIGCCCSLLGPESFELPFTQKQQIQQKF